MPRESLMPGRAPPRQRLTFLDEFFNRCRSWWVPTMVQILRRFTLLFWRNSNQKYFAIGDVSKSVFHHQGGMTCRQAVNAQIIKRTHTGEARQKISSRSVARSARYRIPKFNAFCSATWLPINTSGQIFHKSYRCDGLHEQSKFEEDSQCRFGEISIREVLPLATLANWFLITRAAPVFARQPVFESTREPVATMLVRKFRPDP